ncbi:MAG: Glucokinase [candidate division WS2 bacterium]|nr:Glucokinase [Candidatus Psychracetigena formicireducens]
MGEVCLGIDLGGTKIKGILMKADGLIVYQYSTSTGNNLDNLFEVIEKLIQESKNLSLNICSIGVGCAGLIDHKNGITIESANLPFLKRFPLRDTVYKFAGIPTTIDNDVKMGAIGEMFYGEGKGIKDFVFLTLGTGIGGAIIINGKVYRGISNHSGEIGHLNLQTSGPDCGCGKQGCYETLASGPAIVNYVLYGIQMKRDTMILEKVAGNISKINPSLIAELAEKGDRLCLEALTESARYTGKVLSYLINILNPEKIIIGGGISEVKNILFPIIRETAQLYSLVVPFENCTIIKSGLGTESGVIGAAQMALLKYKGIEI